MFPFVFRYGVSFILSIGLCGGVRPAHADCVSLWATGATGARTPSAARSSFKPDERLVLCVRLERDAFVSLWDVPPRGSLSRLYPNRFTHSSDLTLRAVKLEAGKDHCFGTPNTFPLYFPKEQGLGNGRLSAIVTDTLDGHPADGDWEIPGARTVTRGRMNEITRQYGLGATCTSRMNAYFDYRIAE
ncbi:MAG: DUF4384 domain-containing protein [Hyphomicrobiaceae bacterium]